MQTQRYNIGIAFLNLARCGWVVNATPRQIYPRERDPVPDVHEAGWGPGPVRPPLRLMRLRKLGAISLLHKCRGVQLSSKTPWTLTHSLTFRPLFLQRKVTQHTLEGSQQSAISRADHASTALLWVRNLPLQQPNDWQQNRFSGL